MHRLTITLPDDLYAMARSHAITTKTSISKAIGDLMVRRLQSPPPSESGRPATSGPRLHPISGFPIVESDGRPITCEDVRRAEDDEDIRHLEIMGLSPKEIEEALAR